MAQKAAVSMPKAQAQPSGVLRSWLVHAAGPVGVEPPVVGSVEVSRANFPLQVFVSEGHLSW